MSRQYYMLMSSLPPLPARFDVERCPIIWPRLEDRLHMLEAEDQATLTRLLDFLAWDRQPLDRTDAQVVTHYKSLTKSLSHPLVREIVDERMDVRTIISALRRRRLGSGPPPGVGQWVDPIRRRWNHPQFGLQARFPWITELDQLLNSGAARQAEKLILSISWTKWCREADRHHFSFEAVLIYVSRWAIVQRWTSQNAVTGRERFEQILTQTLDGHVYVNN